MTDHERYEPGPAGGARVLRQDGETWGLILERELRHTPEVVWDALTDPDQLREWAPFDADGPLGSTGNRVKLTTVNAGGFVSECVVTRAEEPRLLIYNWGDNEMRWELEPHGTGTRLTLWTSIDHRYIAMGAAGWHVCFDVLDHLLAGTPLGRIVGARALEFEGWHRLHKEYRELFDSRA
jgi:uncharacterized protein YndB with AHSA1/START domain